MPSRKTINVFIVCVAIIVSTWLILKIPAKTGFEFVDNTDSVVVGTPREEIPVASDDWKKLLTTVDSKTENLLKESSPNTIPEEATLTSQLAKDFLSRSMISMKNGAIDPQDIDSLAQNITSSPDYSRTNEKVYVASNLHIINKNDSSTINSYKTTFSILFNQRFSELQGKDPISIMSTAVTNEKETELAKLDPIIATNKGFISDLLSMEVPNSLVSAHLHILNSANSTLSNIEDMRQYLRDPVRSLIGLNEYLKNLEDLATSIKNLGLSSN